MGLKPVGLEPGLDERGEAIGGNLLQAHDRSGFVERPALAEHAFHQRRLRAREHVAHLALLLHGGAERVLDAPAVEGRDPLKLVERDRHAPAPGLGDAAGQREDLLGEVGHVAIGADRRERDRNLAAPVLVGLDADLGPDAGQHLGQPRSGAIQLGLGRGQRAGVAFEECDVGAVAADLDFDGDGAAPGGALQGLPDQRGLAVATGRNEEDLLAGVEVPAEPVELDFPVDEGRRRDDLPVDEGIGHGA